VRQEKRYVDVMFFVAVHQNGIIDKIQIFLLKADMLIVIFRNGLFELVYGYIIEIILKAFLFVFFEHSIAVDQ
jgi:hypothetical protein